ncbi:hypothetical protein ACIHFC_33080 [Streptomyces sp. NPDC052013]|uniref:hypothetical protein n=1 Tax=Streptomyces sp. NPDC052013 TaxID=3365679 RepID=UPI0037D8ADB4
MAYLCDGKRIEAWMTGTVSPDGTLALAGSDGAHLTARRANGHVSGYVWPAPGKKWSFDLVKASGHAAIYRAASGKKLRATWVVLPDGTQTGILDRDGTPGPAPVLDTAKGNAAIDGTDLTATAITAASNITGF